MEDGAREYNIDQLIIGRTMYILRLYIEQPEMTNNTSLTGDKSVRLSINFLLLCSCSLAGIPLYTAPAR